MRLPNPHARLSALAGAGLLFLAMTSTPIAAQSFTVSQDDTIEKVLAAQKGKRVTVKVGPSDELTGVVKLVTPKVVHLSELAGREFFDAVVDLQHVVAVIVRTR